MLAEIKLRDGADCQVFAIIDGDVQLSGITQIGEMAINAGFKDIRTYIYWRKTRRMPQIMFGTPIKFTDKPDKIEKRETGRRYGQCR